MCQSCGALTREAEKGGKMKDTMIGVDLAKTVFQLPEGVDDGPAKVPQDAITVPGCEVHGGSITCGRGDWRPVAA
jgi:hypothetical protein